MAQSKQEQLRNEMLERMSEDLKDYLHDTFLEKVTPLVFETMYEDFGLTQLDIELSMARMTNMVNDQKDTLIEQVFIGHQVEYLNKILKNVLKGM